MKIASSAFMHEGTIPAQYTCDGANMNPPLMITEVPENAVSLALICDDPDAPMGTWTHWIIWNMDPSTIEIAENSIPSGSVQGITSFDKPGYGGPCPPNGEHRYFFRLYALDTKLELGPEIKVDDLRFAMDNHVIDSAILMGTYDRQK